MKRITALLFAFALAVGLTTAVQAPASAGAVCDASLGAICGDFRHGSPDHGADAPLLATCDLGNPWAAAVWVPEGQKAPCKDADGFWVEYGTVMTCTFSGDGYGSIRVGHTGSWRKITDFENWSCVRGPS